MKKIIILAAFALGALSIRAQNYSSDMSSLTKIQKNVKSRHISSYDTTGGNSDSYPIKKGEKRTILNVKGAGIITHIWITISPTHEELSRNDIVIRMYWDGNSFPSVEAPIGPFFGQGWDESYHFISAPLAASPVKGNGLVSYFQMPFAAGARIEIENQSQKDIGSFYYNIDYTEVKQLPADAGRFHAWYNYRLTEAAPDGENEWGILGEQGKNNDGKTNYLIADIKGKGHFVGVNYFVNSPTPMWYGEGDEMVFIDGEKLPSIIGTGTEDFFNSSWCPKEAYMHPYFGYPRVNGETGWLGRTHCYRFLVTDPIFFDASCRFTIEHGHNNNLTLEISTVAYWYLSSAASVPGISSVQARRPRPTNIGASQLHQWRDAWRKAHGSDPKLWGDEK